MRPLIGITCEAVPTKDRRGHALYLDSRYAQAVREAGGQPVLLPLIGSRESIRDSLDLIDGLIIPGGEDLDPRLYGERPGPYTRLIFAPRTAFEKKLYEAGKRKRLPTFGICYGMQLINVLEGGSLSQHIRGHRHRGRLALHPVNLGAGAALERVLGAARTPVTTSHHQAVKRLAPGFRAAALADDGTIEAVEHPDRPELLAVQWHPERQPESPSTKRLFRHFLKSCRAYRRCRK